MDAKDKKEPGGTGLKGALLAIDKTTMDESARKQQMQKILQRASMLTEELRAMWKKGEYPSIGYIQKVMGYRISGKALLRKQRKLAEEFGFKNPPAATFKLERKKKAKPKGDKKAELAKADKKPAEATKDKPAKETKKKALAKKKAQAQRK